MLKNGHLMSRSWSPNVMYIFRFYHVPRPPLDLDAFEETLKSFEGEHNFASFVNAQALPQLNRKAEFRGDKNFGLFFFLKKGETRERILFRSFGPCGALPQKN